LKKPIVRDFAVIAARERAEKNQFQVFLACESIIDDDDDDESDDYVITQNTHTFATDAATL
jgi:hypothetical protein